MTAPAFSRREGGQTGFDVRAPKTGELLARRLRRMIVDGELKDGDFLPREVDLMAQFGVSRPTLREAVRVLESESLVEVRRGSRTGARVRIPGPEAVARPAALLMQVGGTTLAEVMTARLAVEPLAARLLAQRDSPEAYESLERVLERTKADFRYGRPLAPSLALFHVALVDLSGNRALALMAGMLQEIIARQMATATRTSHVEDPEAEQAAYRKALRAYEKLATLVRAGDGPGAERFWRSHLEAANDLLMRGFESTAVIDILA